MTFKLPNSIPGLRSPAQDWADYAEYLALSGNKISLLAIFKESLLTSDEEIVSGITDDTDLYINKCDDVAAEINLRIKKTNGRYPFILVDNDYSIVFSDQASLWSTVYVFLLMATRVNMTSQKIQNRIDATHVFELLSAEVAKSFLGENSVVDVMGTSKSLSGGFRGKLAEIIRKMGEGRGVEPNDGHQPQDDNVDIIAWKGFSDKLPSQMIAFGQCKTGTSWSGSLSELNTEAFCKTWFMKQPILTPVRMFFCAQYFPNEIWMARAYEAGLVFDRFRILDYLPPELSDDLLQKITSWKDSALSLYKNAS